VLIGPDEAGAAAALPPDLPVLRARLAPGPATQSLRGRRVVAFAGIGRPAKFFATLREAGAELAGTTAFPDHHRFAARELAALRAQAERLGAVTVTTAKDAVRLGKTLRDEVVIADVTLAWQNAAAIESLLATMLACGDAA
jgi:tetraacyldisaccharide 4'-kinase